MDVNESVQVAYGNGPKEVNVKRGMPDGDKQFGKHKMPQDNKPMYYPDKKINSRHKEHR